MQGYSTIDMPALQGMANRKETELKRTMKLKEAKMKAAHAAQSNVFGTYRRVAERNHLGNCALMNVSMCTIVANAYIITRS